MTSATEHALSLTAITAAFANFFGWLQGNVGFLASFLSVCWLAMQMVFAIQNQIDRRRHLRLQAVQDTHTMLRADAVTAALQEAPVASVVVSVPIDTTAKPPV